MGSTGKLNISDTEQETLLDVPAPADENNTQQIKKQRDPKKRPFYSKPKFKMYVFIFSLIIIPLLNFLVFWVYVSFDTVLLTFQKFSVRTGEYEWVGFANYGEVFRDYIFGIGNAYPEKQQIFLNSLHAIAINLIILPLSFIAAYAFFKKVPMEKYFRVCFYLPSIISISVLTICFRNLFHGDFGPIKMLFAKLGFEPVWLSADSEQMWTLIYIFCIWAGLSTNVIMMNSAMMRIPSDISDYTKLEGVGFWREAVTIVLPLTLPTIGIYMISVITSVFGFALQPMLIADNYGTNNKFLTIAWKILADTAGGRQNDMILSSTLGISLTLLLTPFVVLVRWLVNRFTPEVDF